MARLYVFFWIGQAHSQEISSSFQGPWARTENFGGIPAGKRWCVQTRIISLRILTKKEILQKGGS